MACVVRAQAVFVLGKFESMGDIRAMETEPTLTMKTIHDYKIVNHGVENEQYFQGCCVCFTSFEYVATGIGDSARDALEDALESLALDDWDTSSVINDLSTVITVPENSDGCWHYVSIRVR